MNVEQPTNKHGETEHISTDTEQGKFSQQQPRPKTKQRHIDYRRNQVPSLIVREEQKEKSPRFSRLGTVPIHRDIAYLNKRAQDNLNTHRPEIAGAVPKVNEWT